MTRRIIILIQMFIMVPVLSFAGETVGRSIVVKGTAEIRVIPNEVIVSIGVLTTDNNIETATQNNDRKAAKIIEVAMEHGVLKKDIKTDYVRISPNYKHDGYVPVLIGYTAQNNMSLRYDDIMNVSVLIGSLLKAGGNIVNGVTFRHSDIERYHEKARVAAIRSAKGKAKLIAEETGMALGKIRNIDEEPLNAYETRGMVAGAAVRDSGAGMSITPGELDVRATVRAVYDIE